MPSVITDYRFDLRLLSDRPWRPRSRQLLTGTRRARGRSFAGLRASRLGGLDSVLLHLAIEGRFREAERPGGPRHVSREVPQRLDASAALHLLERHDRASRSALHRVDADLRQGPRNARDDVLAGEKLARL